MAIPPPYYPNAGNPYGSFNNSPYYPGSPLDFAVNYLNPNLANITGQINQFLATVPPPGQGGYPGYAQPAVEEESGGIISGLFRGAGDLLGNIPIVGGLFEAAGDLAGGLVSTLTFGLL